MLIGIDASRATSAAPTGTETYSRELIRALLTLPAPHTFRLYTRDYPTPIFESRITNYELRIIPFPRLWTHLRLSFEMLTHPPDVLFVPAHVLPPIHPRRAIVTVHDLGHLHFPDAHPALQRLYHTWATRWNARQATHVLADSEATRDDLVQLCGIAPDKITVVYPAFDARVYQPVRDPARLEATRAHFRIGGDYILTIGTIHPRKNYARLIEAVGRLGNSNLGLVIVGKRGWLYEEIFTQVKRLNLQSLVSFLDYVPAEDMPALISGARMFAFPSLHEGFGLPVLEAQACGVPVVTSMTSSLPEAAGDGALFVDPCDVDALAAAMQRLLGDEVLRAKLVANGFRNLQRFSWEKSARQVLGVIHGLGR
ncbi:MAG: glycosyltransferase family 4 protein [Chloroflexi bacterium]|nr:glycosyltransferase family 4 protein [Chloroflexota bacterium]